MLFQIGFLAVFFILFIYSLIRPFQTISSRLFLMLGSSLGILSLIGVDYAKRIANFIGIGRATDLFLYLSLLTIFLFISYTIQKLDAIHSNISKLTKKIAILDARSKHKKS